MYRLSYTRVIHNDNTSFSQFGTYVTNNSHYSKLFYTNILPFNTTTIFLLTNESTYFTTKHFILSCMSIIKSTVVKYILH